jgi:para-nitrobenzyl esterase
MFTSGLDPNTGARGVDRRTSGGPKSKRRTSLDAVLLALCLLIAGATVEVPGGMASAATSGHASSTVATVDGSVQGTTAGSTTEYLGIPYAAPPVGSLRWRVPQPAAHWPGIRKATHFSPHCPQTVSEFGVASTSENCLYLNVYTSTTDQGKSNLPVMVWFHGGVFVWGESNDWNPAQLVHNGVIVVTVNYRLGALGFLAHPALAGRGGSAGNYGLMDQQAALRWVQENITKFGGNAHKVTIFGESAGGLSVLSQLASSGAHELFSGAIVESGTYSLKQESLGAAETDGKAFAARAGCADQSAVCLRSLPVATILKYQDSGYQPDIDGLVLTRSIKSAFKVGKFNHVPVIDGTNLDERRLFVGIDQLIGDPVSALNYEARIASTLKLSAASAATVVSQYPLDSYPSPAIALSALWTDESFSCPALSIDESLAKYVPTYSYEFADENAPERYEPAVSFSYGASHDSEVQYLFDQSNTPFPGVLSASEQQLAVSMRQDWSSFATHGSPSSRSGAIWRRFTTSDQNTLVLVPPRSKTETNFGVVHHCSFWAPSS